MKTKRFILLLVLTLSSFFFFLDNVKADTVNIAIEDSKLDFIENTFPSVQSTITSIISNGSNRYYTGEYYLVGYTAFLVSSGGAFNDVICPIASYPAGPDYKFYTNVSSTACSSTRVTFTSDWSSYTIYNNTNNLIPFGYSGNNYVFWYSNVSTHFEQYIDRSYVFSNGDNSYTTYNDTSHTMPSIYDLYNLWNSNPDPPTPPDDTPLLTDFVSVVIDRFTFITSSLHSNYILLSCFTIFTLFFIILLFRRLQ